MKLIDADALIAELEIMPIDIGYGDIDKALQVVASQPEAVVRCTDCLMRGICRFERRLGLDGFCSRAKRRTDGETV